MTDWITDWNYEEYLTRQPWPMAFAGGEAGLAYANAFADWQNERAVVSLAKNGHDTAAQRELWAKEIPNLTGAQRKAQPRLGELLKTGEGGGMGLTGLPGRGKSRLAGRFVHLLRSVNLPTAYLSATTFLETTTAIVTAEQKTTTAEKYRSRFETAPALIIDDIAVGKTSEFKQTQLHALLEGRHNLAETAPLITIYTSNLAAANLETYMGKAAYSRLIGLCPEEFKITGKDMRKEKA
jgi:DNA replication protein DnaC